MNKLYPLPAAVWLLLFGFYQANAQSTFSQVRQILQTNCDGSGCHGSGAATFDVTVSEQALYTSLVNVSPKNPYAADSVKHKYITPGYVDRSFLMRKIAHGLNDHLSLKQPHEGNYMPDGGAALPMHQIELIRQWILFGAPQTGEVVDTSVINTYYREGGIEDVYSNHPAPPPGQGFQMYIGKVFIKPGYETYYYIKHNPRLGANVEIPKVETFLPQSCHHFVIYKFLPGGSNSYPEGLRDTTFDSHSDVLDGIGTGPNYWNYELPSGTAYYWDANTILDFNLHIRNGNLDSIMATDLYINVYTQPLGTATDYMLIRNYPVFTISIPQDGQEHTFTEVANDTTETRYWKIWQLYTHTHKYGTDYDVFLRNPNGSMGNQEYEGWYSYEQGFNVGYYRFGPEVTFKYYPDNALLQVDPRLGLIHRAKYRNTNGPNPINWGLTSDEEMMVLGFQYIYGDTLGALPTAIDEVPAESMQLSVFPNPANNQVSVNYVLPYASPVQVLLTNVLGQTTVLVEQPAKEAGNYLEEIQFDRALSPGMYQLTLQTKAGSTTRRLIIE